MSYLKKKIASYQSQFIASCSNLSILFHVDSMRSHFKFMAEVKMHCFTIGISIHLYYQCKTKTTLKCQWLKLLTEKVLVYLSSLFKSWTLFWVIVLDRMWAIDSWNWTFRFENLFINSKFTYLWLVVRSEPHFWMYNIWQHHQNVILMGMYSNMDIHQRTSFSYREHNKKREIKILQLKNYSFE